MPPITRIALASVAATVGLAAAAAPAGAATVSGGHWDVGLAYDCAAGAFTDEGLHAHNHDLGAEEPLATTTFAVTGTSTSSWEASVFSTTQPVKVIGDAGSYRVGISVEAEGDCTPPSVTFRKIANVAVPSGGRAAVYSRAGALASPPTTFFDTTTGSTRNVGLTPTAADGFHVDPRWGFSKTGTYKLSIRATSGGVVIDTKTVTVAVS